MKWACPKCGAVANEHGKGECQDEQGHTGCLGFICECEGDQANDHGESFSDPCKYANCYHCGWGGTFPKKPNGLATWEKKALDAGWKMPEARAKELGL